MNGGAACENRRQVGQSNLSILQRNIIHALGSEIAATAFLRACDQVQNALTAERYALEVRNLVEILKPGLARAADGHGLNEAPGGLLEYILERHRNWWLASMKEQP